MPRMLSPWLATMALFTMALLVTSPARGDGDDAETAAVERPTASSLEPTAETSDHAESEQAAEQRRLIEELREQQAAEQRNAAAARGDVTGFRSNSPFREVRAIEPRGSAGCAGMHAEQAFLGAHQQHRPGVIRVACRGHFSLNRGISSTRLHGRVRASSCAAISSSHAVAHAPDEPGTQNT